jgi:hypothetical protein
MVKSCSVTKIKKPVRVIMHSNIRTLLSVMRQYIEPVSPLMIKVKIILSLLMQRAIIELDFFLYYMISVLG